MKIILLKIFIVIFAINGYSQFVLEMNFINNGETILITNPFNQTKKTYCIDSLLINSKNYYLNTMTDVILLNPDSLGFKCRETIHIETYQKKNCLPNFLNNEVISPKIIAEFDSVSIDSTGTIYWETKNDYHKGYYYIEQFVWNHWIKLPKIEIKSDGIPCDLNNQYKTTVSLISGENIFRVKKVLFSTYSKSKSINIYNKSNPINIEYDKVNQQIIFSSIALFELIDKYNNIIKIDRSNKVDVSQLKNGKYKLNYDNSFCKIQNKKNKITVANTIYSK